MAGLAQRCRNEGFQQFFQDGVRQGRLLGFQRILRIQITFKFGELPQWAETQLNTANIDQLEIWIEQILTASTLENLLKR